MPRADRAWRNRAAGRFGRRGDHGAGASGGIDRAACRARVAACFSVDAMADRYIDLYRPDSRPVLSGRIRRRPADRHRARRPPGHHEQHVAGEPPFGQPRQNAGKGACRYRPGRKSGNPLAAPSAAPRPASPRSGCRRPRRAAGVDPDIPGVQRRTAQQTPGRVGQGRRALLGLRTSSASTVKEREDVPAAGRPSPAARPGAWVPWLPLATTIVRKARLGPDSLRPDLRRAGRVSQRAPPTGDEPPAPTT